MRGVERAEIALEPSYAEGVRRFHEKERQKHLWQRLRFRQCQLESHQQNFWEIIRRHKAALAECEKALQIESTNEEGAAA